MAHYKISGVWKNADNVITHYAFHTLATNGSIYRSTKTSKAEAVALLEMPGNNAITWLWDYRRGGWTDGEVVQVVNGTYGKFLRTNPDNQLTDNLGHIINYDWLSV
jgi:hypothetical protein